MKEKNKKLIIIVASLLVAIGVSLAYFTASVLTGGSGEQVEATTATIKGSELIVEGSLSFNDLDIYPGHQNVSSIKLTATGDNTLIPYNVIWEGSNTLNTPINYTVYKTTNKMDVSASCEKVVGNMGASKIYYEECSISNEEQLGSIISTGTIEKGNTKVTLIPDEFITSSLDGEIVYYYVILEYPNLDESQNIDMGGTFNGEITIEENEVTSDLTIAGIYIEEDGEHKEKNNIPSEGYTLNTEKSTCNNNTSIGWDSKEEQIYVSNLNTSNTECTLYFDEYNPNAAKEYILSHYNQVLTRNDFSQTVTETTTGTIYKSLDSSQYDNDGEVYYFAGNQTDNWVNFGGFYWRIIRINGNGSIRMIYQGTEANTTGTGTQIGTSVFNNPDSSYEYVGLKYTLGEHHGQEIDSKILDALQQWYSSNLYNYEKYIDINIGLCSNRELRNTGEIYYASYDNLVNYKTPTFICDNQDIIKESIGLITADEIVYAGGRVLMANSSFYLNTGQFYWTMTPSYFFQSWNGNHAIVFNVTTTGELNYRSGAYNEIGVRPVINLRADLNLSGSGTSTDPYVVI